MAARTTPDGPFVVPFTHPFALQGCAVGPAVDLNVDGDWKIAEGMDHGTELP